MRTLQESIIGRKGNLRNDLRSFSDLRYGDVLLIKLGSTSAHSLSTTTCCLYLPEKITKQLFPQLPKFLKDRLGRFVYFSGAFEDEMCSFKASNYKDNFPKDHLNSSEIIECINHIEEYDYLQLKTDQDVLELFDKYNLPRYIKGYY